MIHLKTKDTGLCVGSRIEKRSPVAWVSIAVLGLLTGCGQHTTLNEKQSGQSPNFWGRAMGWFAMAQVDILDYLPEDHPDRARLIEIVDNDPKGTGPFIWASMEYEKYTKVKH